MEKENVSTTETVDIKDKDEEENILKFLDSLNEYVTLMDSLSSDLQKGWLDLASARLSMGTSRISSVLFDLKEKPAATMIQISESDKGCQPELHYKLSKWRSGGHEKLLSRHLDDNGASKSNGGQLRHRGSSTTDESNGRDCSTVTDDTILKERAKSLSIFGTLVSPKLRSTQATFESALETIVEIANMRSSLLFAYSQLQKKQAISE